MTYFIIKDTFIMFYLFYYLHKNLNKTNGQTRSLKVKNVTYFRMEGVVVLQNILASILCSLRYQFYLNNY